MPIDISSVVVRFSVETMKTLLGEDAVRLAQYVDPRLLESDSLRKLVLGIDKGISLLSRDIGWREVVDALSQQDANDLCAVLELEGENSYDLLDKNSFRLQNEISQTKTLNFFFIDKLEEPIQEALHPTTLVGPEYPLFVHQRVPAQKVINLLKRDQNRCILHLPTGGGKTRTSMVVVCRWMIENPDKCVVWLASSRELLEQAASEFERAWKYLGDRDVRVRRVWGNLPLADNDFRNTFVVGGLGKLTSVKLNSVESFSGLLPHISLVVFDEAHQALAPTYKNLVDFLVGDTGDVGLLGLTATPGRTPENDVEDAKLAEYFDHKRVTIEVSGYSSAIDYLVSEKYLAQATYIDVEFEAQSATMASSTIQDADFDDGVLKLLGEDQLRNAELVRAAIALSERHKRILLFAPSVESAHQVSLVLRALGIDSFSLDGTTSDGSRRMMIDKFRGNNPTPQVLCNFGVLTTGFDAPRTSCVIIGRPTKSVVLYSQMVGRAIRGARVGGNDHADIVTVVDTTLKGFGAVSDGFNFWNNKWWS